MLNIYAQLYNRYVARDGKKAADKYSARPGYSEHQTGLTFDLGGVNSDKNLYASFGKTKEGQWIAKNAHNVSSQSAATSRQSWWLHMLR